MRTKVDYKSAGRKSYDEFRQAHPNIKLSFIEFKTIIRALNMGMIQHSLDTGEPVNLPRGLGEVVVERKPPRTTFTGKDGVTHILLPIDWVETRKQGKWVHYYNDHSDGWTYAWRWYVRNTNGLRIPTIWRLNMMAYWKKELGRVIKSGEVDGQVRYREYIKNRSV